MTRDEAIKIYLSTDKRRESVIKKLMLWNPNKTASELSSTLNMPIAYVSVFRKRYGLKCISMGYGPRISLSERNRRIVKLIKEGFSQSDVARLYGMTRQNVEFIWRRDGRKEG